MLYYCASKVLVLKFLAENIFCSGNYYFVSFVVDLVVAYKYFFLLFAVRVYKLEVFTRLRRRSVWLV